MSLYREFATQGELDEQYVGDEATALAAVAKCKAASEAARSRLAGRYGVLYGPSAAEYLDIFPSGNARSPVHIFIHGGYWRQLCPELFSFVAERLVERGVTVVLNNYAHCPAVTIDEIVRQCGAAVQWVVENVRDFDGDPDNLSISGHSAGGHLAAMMAHASREGQYGFPVEVIKGICGISGLYDLRPFPFTALQPDLQFTPEQVIRNSPILLPSSALVPLTLLVGEHESEEFHRQTNDYAAKCRADRRDVHVEVMEGADHFSVIDGFLRPSSALFRAILSMCTLS